MTKLHLSICDWCTRYGEHVTLISKATRQRAEDAESTQAARAELPAEARDRIKQLLKDSGERRSD
jgi:hypothetical protein